MVNSLFPHLRAPALREAVDRLASADETDRGAVYTKPEIVAAILDLARYTPDQPLHQRRLLEPSFGGGDFLLPALERLLEAYRRTEGSAAGAATALRDAVRAVEVSSSAYDATRQAVLARLLREGLSAEAAEELASAWLLKDDFLLAPLVSEFDFVVGNPPYVRQERIPDLLLAEYRRLYKTIYDRADLYVPFFERSLALLRPGGRLGFICANRWLKNKYGGPLRDFASKQFHLLYFIDLEGSPAFHSEVIAYPAITVFERGSAGETRIARKPEVSEASLQRLVSAMLNDGAASDPRVDHVARAVAGGDPWLLDAPDRLRLLRRLEDAFPTLEGAGCKVGIGVATGADSVFIGKFAELPVEAERKLPLVMARDLKGLEIAWRGYGVVNPFNDDGSLADLEEFPLFAAYVRANEQRIAGRYCAQKSEHGWYRTIDRIWSNLTTKPKLVIPDIKGEPTVVLDEGRFYPHHNLYFVTSDEWELPALATVLRSSIAVLFVSSYCVRMSGGFLRFQAQYLRRIHVPRWSGLSEVQREALRGASRSLDNGTIDAAVGAAFGLTSVERALARQISDEARIPRKNSDAPTPSP
jgi:hypothetical protein